MYSNIIFNIEWAEDLAGSCEAEARAKKKPLVPALSPVYIYCNISLHLYYFFCRILFYSKYFRNQRLVLDPKTDLEALIGSCGARVKHFEAAYIRLGKIYLVLQTLKFYIQMSAPGKKTHLKNQAKWYWISLEK